LLSDADEQRRLRLPLNWLFRAIAMGSEHNVPGSPYVAIRSEQVPMCPDKLDSLTEPIIKADPGGPVH
jgi:hypothetical protein